MILYHTIFAPSMEIGKIPELSNMTISLYGFQLLILNAFMFHISGFYPLAMCFLTSDSIILPLGIPA